MIEREMKAFVLTDIPTDGLPGIYIINIIFKSYCLSDSYPDNVFDVGL